MPDQIVEPVVPPAPDHAAENAALKQELAALKAASTKPPAPAPEDDLLRRARESGNANQLDAARMKRLESSIGFNMQSGEFLKANSALLPAEVENIFKEAEKETFSDATEKADAIKSGLIQSFFSVQENEDLLTGGQKAQLDEYRKLTKTGKQEKAQALYDMVFEPAFNLLKQMKKADALNRGLHSPSGIEEARKKRLIERSEKYHFRGKKA